MESHIIPRACFRGLKRKSGQLIKSDYLEGSSLEVTNSDPKEPLLCHRCEQFLSSSYEQYGTRLFKNPKGVVKKEDSIEFSNFEYERFYLYLLSILWRASVSKLPEFSEVDLPSELANILRSCIEAESPKINDNLSIDDFFRVSVYRLIDSTNTLEDKVIKGLLTTFIQTTNEKDETVYYFTVDGFLIKYVFTVGANENDVKTSKNHGQLEKDSTVNMLKAEITDFPELVEMIRNLTRKVKSRA
ncbi:hypothetical protein [Moritella marina]|uniref:hypothetical protein n=1 Tax=Moritella marina TaxID=90736 RepID=UPI0002EE3630|nr:hypothetical protein [Moritella marina]